MVIAAIGPVADVVANATIAVDWGNATAASSVGRVVLFMMGRQMVKESPSSL